MSVTSATNHIIIKLLFPSLDVETAGTTTVKRDNNRRQTFPSIGIPINNPPTVRTASIPKYNEKYFLNIGLFINKTVAKPKAKNITNIGMSPVKTSPMSICGFLNIQEKIRRGNKNQEIDITFLTLFLSFKYIPIK